MTEAAIHHRATAQCLSWVEEVLFTEPFAQSEPVVYDVGMAALPDGGQENRWVPFLILYLEIKGPDERHPAVFGAAVVKPYALTQGLVRGLVLDTLKSLREERDAARKALAEEALAKAAQNGRGRDLVAQIEDEVAAEDHGTILLENVKESGD